MSKLKLLSLCSGIGSPELAAARVWDDVRIVAACEIDKFSRQTYEANFDIDPQHYHDDVTAMDAMPYCHNTDALIGGFPCQAFSVAGLRLGFEDTRGTIFYDFVRILNETQPKFFVFENVKGLVGHGKEKDVEHEVCFLDLFGEEQKVKTTTKGRNYFSKKHNEKEIGRTLSVMEDVLDGTGYFWTWEVLNTKDFGVPQNRERIFMVGFKLEEDFNNFSFPDAFPLEKRLEDILEDDVDEKYFLNERQIENIEKSNFIQNRRIIQGNQVVDTLCTRDFKDPKCVVVGMLDIKGTDQIRRVYDIGGVSPALTTMQGGNQEPKIFLNPRVRKLTPLECFRLQDFPNSFKKVVSNSQLYKQAGNSITVAVMEQIMNKIKIAISGQVVSEAEMGGLFREDCNTQENS